MGNTCITFRSGIPLVTNNPVGREVWIASAAVDTVLDTVSGKVLPNAVAAGSDEGKPFVVSAPDSDAAGAFKSVVDNFEASVARLSAAVKVPTAADIALRFLSVRLGAAS